MDDKGQIESNELRRIAFREAGHAVYLQNMGWPVIWVTTNPSSESDAVGATKIVDYYATDFPLWGAKEYDAFIEDTLRSLLAGSVAVEIDCGQPVEEAFKESSSGTLVYIADSFMSFADICRHLGVDYDSKTGVLRFGARVESLCAEASEVLHDLWPAVERTANLLSHAGVISGKDVRHFIRDLGRPESEWMQRICMYCGVPVPFHLKICDPCAGREATGWNPHLDEDEFERDQAT